MNLSELGDRLKPIPSIWLKYPEEWELLLKYAGLATSPIVEIGTAFGGSACLLTLGSNQIVWSIDPFTGKPDGYEINADNVRQSVRDILGSAATRWELWSITSEQAHKPIKQYVSRFGLVFIDGDHNYAFVRQDVDLWLPMIKTGGYLLLHDSANRDLTELQYVGPHRVAAELAMDERVEKIDEAFSITVWKVK